MNRAVLALMIAGFLAFGAGAWVAATSSREIGIGLMGAGLLFQVLTLRQLRQIRKTEEGAR